MMMGWLHSYPIYLEWSRGFNWGRSHRHVSCLHQNIFIPKSHTHRAHKPLTHVTRETNYSSCTPLTHTHGISSVCASRGNCIRQQRSCDLGSQPSLILLSALIGQLGIDVCVCVRVSNSVYILNGPLASLYSLTGTREKEWSTLLVNWWFLSIKR